MTNRFFIICYKKIARRTNKLSWCYKPARRVNSQSRSPNMVPFDMLSMVSY